MVYEVNILRYVAKHLNQPVPEVVCFDSTTNNALKMPYMIQRRLEGQQFEELWHEMNGEQKQSATRGLTQLLLDMRKIKSDRPGILSESPDIEFPAVLEKYPLDFDRRQKNSPLELARPQTTVQWFRDMCQHRKQTQVQLGTAGAQTLPFDCRPEIMIWDQIASCIEKLYEMGFMPDTAEFCLFHGDLHGCNILAKMVNDSTVEITGVIDWDMAAFGPDVLTLGTAWSTFGKILQDPICRRVCKDMMGPAYERMMPYGSQLVSSLFRILRFGISQELSLCNAQDYINAILTRDLFELPYASKPKDKLYYWGSTLYYHE
jgi:aminoglycoside phosphotransferase (APT) family kinase protein